MTDIGTVVTALATALAPLQLVETKLQILTELNSEVIPPAILIDTPDNLVPTNLPQTQFTETYGILVVVPFSDQIQAQRALRPYLSATGSLSIRARLMADITLGGVVHGLEVLSHGGGDAVPVDIDETAFLYGAAIPVEIDH